jgi:DNA-binding LacI/PurR family transcriptional regulator
VPRPSAPQRANLRLADIAQLAGVGLGTASRALRNEPGVAEATRQRVLAVAEQYSYVVSPEAARLAGRSTARVGLLVPHLSRWFFGTMVEAIDGVLRDAQLDVLLYAVGDLEDRRRFFKDLPARRKVDAVIVVAFPVEGDDLVRLHSLGVHVVAAGGQHATYPYVCVDDFAAGRLAMDHLITLGHRRIGMIESVDVDQPRQPTGRSRAYRAALRVAGVPFDPALVARIPWGGEHGAHAMERLMALEDRPTAIYAHSDELAFGALRTARRLGLSIPEDVSVVGVDDHPMASLADLTTVRQPVREQGAAAASMMLSLLQGSEPPDRALTFSTELVVRASTGPPRLRDARRR